MSNSVDPDETAHDEPSHLDLHSLQKPFIIAYGSERVKWILLAPKMETEADGSYNVKTKTIKLIFLHSCHMSEDTFFFRWHRS